MYREAPTLNKGGGGGASAAAAAGSLFSRPPAERLVSAAAAPARPRMGGWVAEVTSSAQAPPMFVTVLVFMWFVLAAMQ